MIKLSIVIINYNTKDITINCITSINDSKLKISYEIILIDNESTDGSLKKFKSVFSKFKNIHIIGNSKNLGFAKAVNQGIKTSKGKYKLLINSDVVVTNKSIEKLVNFAETQNDAGVVAPKLILSGGKFQHSVFNFPTVKRAINEYWFGKGGEFSSFTPKGDKATKVEAVAAAAFLITPSALEKVGLMDERYFMYFEDLDYCRRVKKASLSVYYLPNVSVLHHHGESGKNLAPDDKQWKRLIPSSKIYHGRMMHYLINFVIWSSQKLRHK